MEMESTLSKLAAAARKKEEADRLDLGPGCTFGAVIEQRLKDIERELAEVKGRLNGLIFLVISAVVIELILRLVKV